MRILITATNNALAPTGVKLTDALLARGHHAVYRPLIRPKPRLDVSLPNLEKYAVAICVSRHAALYLCQLIKRQPPLKSLPPFFAPGQTTAAYLRRCGILTKAPPRRIGSEAILVMPALAAERIQGKEALLIRGDQGRNLLATTLIQRGMKVDQLVLYTLEIKQYAATTWQQPFDLIWATSGHILRALADNTRPWFADAVIAVPSRRLAQLACHLQLGSSRIVALDNSYAETFLEYVAHQSESIRV